MPATTRLADRIERELISLYRVAAARTRSLLDEAIASEKLGAIRYRKARIAAIQAVLAGLVEPTGELVDDLAQATYAHGADRVDALIQSGETFGGGVHAEALRAIADNLTAQLNAARDTLGRRAEDSLRKEGLRQVALGLAGGDTRRETSKQLVAQLRRQGMTAFQDAAGRRWTLDTYAAMAVRTTTREAASIGTRNRLLEQGLDLVDVSEHPHEADEHDECDRYAGRTFSLTGKTPGFPILDRLPPYHPNCKHYITPSAKNLDQLDADDDPRYPSESHGTGRVRPTELQRPQEGDDPARPSGFPDLDALESINRVVHEEAGQQERIKLDERAPLQSLLDRTLAAFVPTPQGVMRAAAELAYGIAYVQAFRDGNRRTAYFAALQLLTENDLGHLMAGEDHMMARHLNRLVEDHGRGRPSRVTVETFVELFERRLHSRQPRGGN